MKTRNALRSGLAPLALMSLFALCAAPSALAAGGTEGDAAAEENVLEDVAGTVTKVGNLGFGLVPDAEPGTRYAPTEPLAEEFQQDGLRVRFSGVVGDPDDVGGRGGRGGRRWGTPLEVTAIELLDDTGDEPDDDPGSGRS